jgi:all-trans-8'-apo-beta-carotenal 15,15'-oxygenase
VDDGSARARLARIALHPDGRARFEPLPFEGEFPRNDPRFAGLKRRLTFHLTGSGDRPLPRGLAATNVTTGRSDAFDFGPRHLVEEMLFVPRPGSGEEGEGWLVGTSINLDARATELHLFDAGRVSAGPLASWRADVALPYAFHGAFVAG